MLTPTIDMPDVGDRHWVLWDGECGFCRRAVQWVQRRDRRNVLQIVPYQRAPEPPMTEELRRACGQAVQVVTTDGRVLSAGRASLFVIAEIGCRRLAALLSLPPLVWCVELGYLIVARNRRLFSRLFFNSKLG